MSGLTKAIGEKRWMDWFLPEEVRTAGGDLERRARLLIAFTTILFGAGVAGIIFDALIESSAAAHRIEALCFAVSLAPLVPLALRFTGSLRLAANLAALIIFSVLAYLAFQTGALGRPVLGILALVPMLTIVITGVRWGILWTVLGCLVTLALYDLKSRGFVFPDPPAPEVADKVYAIVNIITFVLAFCLAASYESRRNRTLRYLEAANRELSIARDTAEAAMRARSAFLATMSHEIRTPMNAVLGTTGLLLDSQLTNEQRDLVEMIQTSSDALLSIINDILDFTKIESGNLELEAAPLDPRAVVSAAISVTALKARERDVRIAVDIADSLPEMLIGDAVRLRQILINLLSNAVKFTERGEVRVTASARLIEPMVHEIEFAVSDTGIGIPADRMDRLFRSFSQVDASTTRRYGGSGLGLAISHRLTEHMGGRIWVESEVGVGSTFHFSILCRIAPDPDAEREATTQVSPTVDLFPPTPSPLRILLAEDNAMNRKVALKILERLGHSTKVAENGREVIAALEHESYDLVLMDVQMPEMDGIEATREICNRWGAGERPRIVAMTANVLAEDRAACLAAGMDDFVSKPITSRELLEALERCRSGSRAMVDSAEAAASAP